MEVMGKTFRQTSVLNGPSSFKRKAVDKSSNSFTRAHQLPTSITLFYPPAKGVTRQDFDIITPASVNFTTLRSQLTSFRLSKPSKTTTRQQSRCATGSRPSSRSARTAKSSGWPIRAPSIQGTHTGNAGSIPRRARSLLSSPTHSARSVRTCSTIIQTCKSLRGVYRSFPVMAVILVSVHGY